MICGLVKKRVIACTMEYGLESDARKGGDVEFCRVL